MYFIMYVLNIMGLHLIQDMFNLMLRYQYLIFLFYLFSLRFYIGND